MKNTRTKYTAPLVVLLATLLVGVLFVPIGGAGQEDYVANQDGTIGAAPQAGDVLTYSIDLPGAYPELAACLDAGFLTDDTGWEISWDYDGDGTADDVAAAVYNNATPSLDVVWAVPTPFDLAAAQTWQSFTHDEAGLTVTRDNADVVTDCVRQPVVPPAPTPLPLAIDLGVEASTTIDVTKELAAGSIDPASSFELSVATVSTEADAAECVVTGSPLMLTAATTGQVTVVAYTAGGTTCQYEVTETEELMPVGCSLQEVTPTVVSGPNASVTVANLCVQTDATLTVGKVLSAGSVDPGVAFEFVVMSPAGCVASSNFLTLAAGESQTVDVVMSLDDGTTCTYSVEEIGLPEGCTVSGDNPAEAMVVPDGNGGEAYTVGFRNDCVEVVEPPAPVDPVDSTLTISKVLSAGSVDPGVAFEFVVMSPAGCVASSNFLTLAAGESQTVDVVKTTADGTECTYSVEEIALPDGCTVSGDNPAEAMVVPDGNGGEAYTVGFRNDCVEVVEPPAPVDPVDSTLTISKVLSAGSVDPGVAFEFVVMSPAGCVASSNFLTLAAGESQTVDVVKTTADGTECTYSVEEIALPEGCTVSGDNPAEAMVVPDGNGGEAYTVGFRNDCVEVVEPPAPVDPVDSTLTIAKSLTDGSEDPGVDFEFVVMSPPNCIASANFLRLAAGESQTVDVVKTTADGTECTYSIEEIALPDGCTVAGDNPAQALIETDANGDEAFTVAFSNDCAPAVEPTPVESRLIVSKVLTAGSDDPAVDFDFVITGSEGCEASPATLKVGEGDSSIAQVVLTNADGAACTYTVEEVSLPDGCTVVGENPATALQVPWRDGIDQFVSGFRNDCPAAVEPPVATANLVVSKTLSAESVANDFTYTFDISSDQAGCTADPATVLVAADASETVVVPVAGSDDATCQYQVTEVNVPPGCQVVGANPVAVAADGDLAAAFVNDCVQQTQDGQLHIAKLLAVGTADPGVPFTFVIASENADCVAQSDRVLVDAGTTRVVDVVLETDRGDTCTYVVQEVELPAGCQLVSEPPVTQSTANVIRAEFVNDCGPISVAQSTAMTITKVLEGNSIDPGTPFEIAIASANPDCVVSPSLVSVSAGETATVTASLITEAGDECSYEAVELNLPADCSVVGPNPATATLVPNDAGSVDYLVGFVNRCVVAEPLDQTVNGQLTIGKFLAADAVDGGFTYSVAITSAIPGCVVGSELVSISAGAQINVPATLTTSAGDACVYSAQEVNLPPGCAVTSANPVSLSTATGLGASFINDCVQQAEFGQLLIAASLADGSLAANGDFQFTVSADQDGCEAPADTIAVAANSTTSVNVQRVTDRDEACTYTVTATTLPAGCTVVGDRTVDAVQAGNVLRAEFINDCRVQVQDGVFSISKSLTGLSEDPGTAFSFTITSDNPQCVASATAEVAAGSFAVGPMTVSTDTGEQCSYTVTEVNLPDGCEVVGDNPVVPQITSAGMAVDFVNKCNEQVVDPDVARLDLDIEKSVTLTQATYAVGDTVQYTITVTNNGTVDATNVEVTDELPASLELADLAWTGTDGNAATIVLTGPIAPGQSETVSLTAKILSVGTLTNSVSITSSTAIDAEGQALELSDVDSQDRDSAAFVIAAAPAADTTTTTATTTTVRAAPTFSFSPTTPVAADDAADDAADAFGAPPVRLAFTGADSNTLARDALAAMLMGGGLCVIAWARREDGDDLS